MKRRSKGIQRITTIISILSVIGWISYVGFASNGFSQVKPVGWLIFVGGIFVAYYVPPFMSKTTYWVLDGFNEDKET